MLLINPYPLVPVPVRCDSLSSMAQYIFPLTYYIVTPVLNSAIQVRFGGFPLIFQNGQLSLNLFTYATNATWNYPTSWGSCFQSGIDLWAINKQNIEYNLSSTDTIVIQGKTVSLIQTP